jgi:polyferredoxin
MRSQRTIRAAQWAVVAIYATLIVVPALLPLPARAAHVWSNVTLFAQFAFWGVWWPFVLLSMVLVGRAWCGLLCPEGALSEFISRRGRGLHVPRFIAWRGWPFVAFTGATVYGQMISVYQYPKPALLILGGSTLGAVLIGGLYGRGKRVWCRYLCPVNGVFGLLAKLAPLHFMVDQDAWSASPKPVGKPAVNCAPLVPIRTMRGGSACHMCGRCSSFRGAVRLARRSPMDEIVRVAGGQPKPWETALIVFGLMGVAVGAFHWSNSDVYIAVKQALAGWLVERGWLWPLEPHAPWWLLTNYPDQNDTMSLLDGAVLLGYIAATALIIGSMISALLALAALCLGRWSARIFHHLAQSLIPVAACGVFLGLSSLTVTMLRAEGVDLGAAVAWLRAALIIGAALWSLAFAWAIAGAYSHARARRLAAIAPIAAATAIGSLTTAQLFWPLIVM